MIRGSMVPKEDNALILGLIYSNCLVAASNAPSIPIGTLARGKAVLNPIAVDLAGQMFARIAEVMTGPILSVDGAKRKNE